jgi:hypothetical protein
LKNTTKQIDLFEKRHAMNIEMKKSLKTFPNSKKTTKNKRNGRPEVSFFVGFGAFFELGNEKLSLPQRTNFFFWFGLLLL